MAIQTCLYVVSWALHAKMSLSSKHYYARQKRPLLVHCASGNRVGATAALRAAWVEGHDAKDAIGIGKAWDLSLLRARSDGSSTVLSRPHPDVGDP